MTTPNPYIDRSHPGKLVDTVHHTTWALWGIPDKGGLTPFIAGGSTSTAVWGLRLVLQDGAVYALQLDGSWQKPTVWGTHPTTTDKVVDPLAVDPPPIVEPPPQPHPEEGQALVHPMKGLTNCNYVDEALAAPWVKQMGDCWDADGVLNGPKPTIALAAGSTFTIPLGPIKGDLLIQQHSSITQVLLDGLDVTAASFWTDPTSAYSMNMPSKSGRPVIVPNPGMAKVLTIVGTTTKPWRVDAVACPNAAAPAVVEGFTPPDLLRIYPTSFADVVIKGSIPAASTDANRCFGGEYAFLTTPSGVPFVRCHPPKVYYPGVGGGRVMRVDYPLPPQEQMWMAGMIQPADNFSLAASDGVKGFGPTGDEQRWNEGEEVTIYYGIRNPRNAGIVGMRDYYYSGDAGPGQGPGNGQNSKFNVGYLSKGKPTHIEIGGIRNTFQPNGTPNKDGRKIIKLNGVVVQDIPITWFLHPTSYFNMASQQIYNGGTGRFFFDTSVDVYSYMASTRPIGIAPEFLPLLGA